MQNKTMSTHDIEDFVQKFYKKIVEDGTLSYKESYFVNSGSESSTSYGKRVLPFIAALDQHDQETILMIMRQVLVDATSQVFGIIDGSSEFGVHTNKLRLILLPDIRASGYLQDTFLSVNEDREDL